MLDKAIDKQTEEFLSKQGKTKEEIKNIMSNSTLKEQFELEKHEALYPGSTESLKSIISSLTITNPV